MSELTDAELERLSMLAEECGETIVEINKIIRHGYENYHPHDPIQTSNRQRVVNEVTDIFAVLKLFEIEGDLDGMDEPDILEVLRNKMYYTHHQNKDKVFELLK